MTAVAGPETARARARVPSISRDRVVRETLFLEGVYPDGRTWDEVLREFRVAARQAGVRVRVAAKGRLGVRLDLVAPLGVFLEWRSWAPAEIPFDPRCVTYTLRKNSSSLQAFSLSDLRSAMWPGGAPARLAAA